ncbi:MAG: hypothetical protein NWE99_09345 [Candidatus Bathyarchaeota archaeon]|nr:hypothetical protein [Candidatus Bathyarchaeota archaeon]
MTTVKASLRNRGSGRLEFANGTLRFYVERGRFRKTSELVREVPIADVEVAAVAGKEFSITWKGVADVFDVETAESAKAICDEVNASLEKPAETAELAEPMEAAEAEVAEEKAPQQKPIALGKMVGVALGVVDSLFDVLQGLQGRVDWKRVEDALKRSEEGAGALAGEAGMAVSLDFAGLSSAVKLHRAGEVSKETFGILKSLFGHFAGLAIADEDLLKTRLSVEDARRVVLTSYLLNDIILGVVVGDAEVAKERVELAAVLEELSKQTGVKMDVDAVNEVVNRLIAEKAGENVVEESRTLLRKQVECHKYLTAVGCTL